MAGAYLKFKELFAYLTKYGDELRESRTLVKSRHCRTSKVIGYDFVKGDHVTLMSVGMKFTFASRWFSEITLMTSKGRDGFFLSIAPDHGRVISDLWCRPGAAVRRGSN